jgi:Flp pilus assembly protein TadD
VKAIKSAYYDVVKVFHPDRHYGKNLGGYRPKLGRIFARLTEAHDVLTRDGRERYDAELAARVQTRHFTASAPPPPSTSGAWPSVAPSSRSGSQPAMPSDSDELLRRKALARKLSSSSVPPVKAPTSSGPPSSPSSERPAASERPAISEELKRRHEELARQTRQQQVQHYMALAAAATAKNDLVSAANALRVASSLAPEDSAISDRIAELERKAAEEHWEDYAERGKAEAQEGRFSEAARCYERAVLGRPIARLLERTAFCIVEARGDLRKAGDFARRAVALAPQSPRCRLTLAQVYFAAKLPESALAELERARALDPEHEAIKELIRRVKRGEI